MRNFIQILLRNSNFLIFLILEVVAFILICSNNDYQRSSVWSGANRLVASSNEIRSAIHDYFSLRRQNELLASENAHLKTELMLLSNKTEQITERTKGYIYSHLAWDYIPAKVIGVSTNKQHNYLTLNKGLRDGIELDMGVICADGVVGVVSAVSEKYSLVVPIIHTQISISCQLQNNGQICGTDWDGKDYRYVHLTELSRHIDVHQGDTVVTSGLTPVFPEGIHIGEISQTTLNPGDNYHNTKLRISTDYKSLKYVQILKNKNKQHYGVD